MSTYRSSTREEPTATTGRPRRAPRASLWALRLTAVLHTASICAQPILAGQFLAGDVDAITIHEANAHLAGVLAFVQTVVAVAYASRGRGRRWPLVLGVALMVLEETQKVFGYVGLLAFHVPFGIALLTTQLVFTIWTFRPAARQPRPDKASHP